MQMTEQDWETRRERRRARRRCTPVSGAARLYLSLLLIIAGLLLFLGNLGLFPLHSVFELWPLVLVAIGLGRWSDNTKPGNRIWASMMIVFGAVFFCISMGFLRLRAHDGTWPIAIALITFGIMALTKAVDRSATQPQAFAAAPEGDTIGAAPTAGAQTDFLSDSAILGSVQRRVETVNLRGGLLTCILGNIELDLRRAQVLDPHEPITVEATCVMGSIKLRIPETWRFSVVGVPVLGSYQDKTVPVARPDFITGTLVISGSCVIGSVEIES